MSCCGLFDEKFLLFRPPVNFVSNFCGLKTSSVLLRPFDKKFLLFDLQSLDQRFDDGFFDFLDNLVNLVSDLLGLKTIECLAAAF